MTSDQRSRGGLAAQTFDVTPKEGQRIRMTMLAEEVAEVLRRPRDEKKSAPRAKGVSRPLELR